MEKISSIKIAQILNVDKNIVFVEIDGVSTDSRKCSKNDS